MRRYRAVTRATSAGGLGWNRLLTPFGIATIRSAGTPSRSMSRVFENCDTVITRATRLTSRGRSQRYQAATRGSNHSGWSSGATSWTVTTWRDTTIGPVFAGDQSSAPATSLGSRICSHRWPRAPVAPSGGRQMRIRPARRRMISPA